MISLTIWQEIKQVKIRLQNMIRVLEDLSTQDELPRTTANIIKKTLKERAQELLLLADKIDEEQKQMN